MIDGYKIDLLTLSRLPPCSHPRSCSILLNLVKMFKQAAYSDDSSGT